MTIRSRAGCGAAPATPRLEQPGLTAKREAAYWKTKIVKAATGMQNRRLPRPMASEAAAAYNREQAANRRVETIHFGGQHAHRTSGVSACRQRPRFAGRNQGDRRRHP